MKLGCVFFSLCWWQQSVNSHERPNLDKTADDIKTVRNAILLDSKSSLRKPYVVENEHSNARRYFCDRGSFLFSILKAMNRVTCALQVLPVRTENSVSNDDDGRKPLLVCLCVSRKSILLVLVLVLVFVGFVVWVPFKSNPTEAQSVEGSPKYKIGNDDTM